MTVPAGTGAYEATLESVLSQLQSGVSNPSVGTDGSAAPTSSTQIGGSDGTNLQGALVESSSHPNLRIAIFNGANQLGIDAVGRLFTGVFTSALFTTAQNTVGSNNSGDLDVSKLHSVSIDINTTAQAGTNPTIQFFWERKGADNIYYILWQSAVLTAASNTLSTSIGPGLAYNQALGVTGRLRWVVGGTASPNWSFTPNVYGK